MFQRRTSHVRFQVTQEEDGAKSRDPIRKEETRHQTNRLAKDKKKKVVSIK